MARRCDRRFPPEQRGEALDDLVLRPAQVTRPGGALRRDLEQGTVEPEGPGVRRQALHAEPQGRRGAPTGPITLDPGAEPYLLRGFVEHGGVKRTHVVSVGDPTAVNYTYDLQTGTLLLGWRGPFLETTQMWEGRGEPQLAEPRGSAVELPGGPTLALASEAAIWPDSLQGDAGYRFHGYDLDEAGRPVFRYRMGDAEVEDRVVPLEDRRGLAREIRVSGEGAPFAARLAAGETIERLRDWRVTSARMQRTRKGAFMHCLPVRRNVVVDDAVLDGPQAIHLLQAEFRLHAQKAILQHVWQL